MFPRLAALLLLLLSLPTHAAESVAPPAARVAVIDSEGVLISSKAGRAMLQRMKQAQSEHQAALAAISAEVGRLEREISSRKSSGADTAELQRQLTAKRTELDRYPAQASAELAALRDRELEAMNRKIDPLMREVVAELKLTDLVDTADPAAKKLVNPVDITAEVIRRANAAE